MINVGVDSFFESNITGFDVLDWEALIMTNESNCQNFNENIICRTNNLT